MSDDQQRLVLTAHPLQRIGAFAFAALARARTLDAVSPELFAGVVQRMTDDAVRAALVRDSKRPAGYWLRCSRSFFPNAKMNHPSAARKDDSTLSAEVRRWRQMPHQETWPQAECILCGRRAVGYFGKSDVPLAESDIYRNTTPRGHEGTALCWPCLNCFYALPYGCRLTGGPSIAVHSWDDRFLAQTTDRQVDRNLRIFETGEDVLGSVPAREVVALDALHSYESRVTAGVDLMVFSNDNRGQILDIYTAAQPLAEWLRRQARGGAYGALLRAHHTERASGPVGLARNAFRDPERIVRACAQYLVGPAADQGAIRPEAPALARLMDTFVEEVIGMDHNDLAEIKATARRIAARLYDQSAGKLNSFYVQCRDQRKLRAWLQQESVRWVLEPAEGETGSLVTTRGYELLFSPGLDSQAWFHRELLLIAVIEDLYRRGWKPDGAAEVVSSLPTEPSLPDSDEEEGSIQ